MAGDFQIALVRVDNESLLDGAPDVYVADVPAGALFMLRLRPAPAPPPLRFTNQQLINAVAKVFAGTNWWADVIVTVGLAEVLGDRARRNLEYSGPAVSDWPLWGTQRAAVLAALDLAMRKA